MRMRFLFAAVLALLPAVAMAQSNAGSSGGGGGGGGSLGPYYVGQYNATLPSFANGQVGYVQFDSNGRMILSPGTTMTVNGTVTANIGTTNGLALDSTLTTVANSNSAINSATGTTADTATASGANTTIIGALRAIRDRLLGTLATTVSSSALPTGAATATNQTTVITSLAAIQQRAVTFAEQSGGSVAASGTATGTSRDAGASPLYSKYNAVIASNQNGTLSLQGSNDNFTTNVSVASVSVTASVPAYITAPVMFRYNRYVFVNANTTTAATVSINSSYTAN